MLNYNELLDSFFNRLSLQDNDIVKIHQDLPNVYSDATREYSNLLTKIAIKTKKINKLKATIYKKYRQNIQFDLKKGEIEDYYLNLDKDILNNQHDIDLLEIYITRFEKLFQLLNNMSFITGNFIKLQEKRGIKL